MISANDKVSVVITHYDRIDLLARAVNSVILQGDIVGEIIVVDDCSPGISKAEIESALPSSDLVQVIRLDVNSGSQSARNKGAQASRFELIALLDSDDEWLAEKLIKQTAFMRSKSLDLCATAFHKCISGGELTSERRVAYTGSPSEYLFKSGGHLQTSTMLMSRNLWSTVGFPPSVKKFQDWDFSIRAEILGFRVGYLPEALSVYHFGHGDQMTGAPNTAAVRSLIESFDFSYSPDTKFFALTRTLARTEIESGDILSGFRTYASACLTHSKFDLLGLAKLVRKSVLFCISTNRSRSA